ncbi:two-component system LytT family response regulator [Parabacteroides sp. PF5-5]|uniref:LytR/AlgR family response regulator transcription factor n=1 Tax=unclassified Parabacteroides TaxID=2649774 RepID=UPI002474A179|nr:MULTISPECIES: LytTR family DNA-binding domain-containing protein [unclassified Parabacteroides]MDH6305293.1 two-component system LytT family response regulator [Parabacteroides sp. PH5-39]MDH6316646.1 two-component system LytT family response regulator [Parabacteroides sp. PF5-13]MDH6320174.1 two-component system LytT family response regulator [Parabacteroides sp. PH5-13]MDH6323883.1 two-component system LytT family response regulator [Parabacteroides sp. PH5-8]MDH6327851.1 two-component sy
MKCIIVDDEPIARKGMKKLIEEIPQLELLECFNNAEPALEYMKTSSVDLLFLDIQMQGMNGIELARIIPKHTLIIFTTAYSEYALDSYEVDAIDYLVKPIDPTKFRKAVNKAITYHSLLLEEEEKSVENIEGESIFVKSDRRFFKVNLKDILFIEALKDYVIIQMDGQRIITRMNVKTIHDLLPKKVFLRINRSYIVNKNHIESFDNNDVFIKAYEIAIGNSYRDDFFKELMSKST